jgi:site-specific DNA recombinase
MIMSQDPHDQLLLQIRGAVAEDDLVWQDLCVLLADPSYINQALARAHGGQWLPQELQARRDGLRKVITSLTQQLKALRES